MTAEVAPGVRVEPGISIAGSPHLTAVTLAMTDVEWRLVDPTNLSGPLMAVLWEDPQRGPYGALLPVPAGFHSPLHRHTRDERVIMISGISIHWTQDESRHTARPMTAGDFLLMPAGTAHVSAAGTDDDALEFITQDGPFDLSMAFARPEDAEPAKHRRLVMRDFSPAELDYLGERRLGRLATIDPAGRPHVVPIGMWQINAELGTLDVTGHDFAATRKYQHVGAHPTAAFVVDDMAPTRAWHPRAVMVSGPAEAVAAAGGREALIRITPERIVSWGLDDGPDRASLT